MKKFIFLTFLIFISTIYADFKAENSLPNIAIYSGSFDPPTLAHKAIVLKALKVGVKKVYILLNTYGKKTSKASAKERLDMLNLMFTDIKDNVVILEQNHLNKREDYVFIKKIINEPIALITGYDSYIRGSKVPDKHKVFLRKSL